MHRLLQHTLDSRGTLVQLRRTPLSVLNRHRTIIHLHITHKTITSQSGLVMAQAVAAHCVQSILTTTSTIVDMACNLSLAKPLNTLLAICFVTHTPRLSKVLSKCLFSSLQHFHFVLSRTSGNIPAVSQRFKEPAPHDFRISTLTCVIGLSGWRLGKIRAWGSTTFTFITTATNTFNFFF